jgi:hypothetical protein
LGLGLDRLRLRVEWVGVDQLERGGLGGCGLRELLEAGAGVLQADRVSDAGRELGEQSGERVAGLARGGALGRGLALGGGGSARLGDRVRLGRRAVEEEDLGVQREVDVTGCAAPGSRAMRASAPGPAGRSSPTTSTRSPSDPADTIEALDQSNPPNPPETAAPQPRRGRLTPRR